MLQNFDTLSSFYSFHTARLRWCNHFGSQRAIENAVNILINGSKKYNKNRRTQEGIDGREKKTSARYQSSQFDSRHTKIGKKKLRNYKEKFEEGDRKKMPIVVFGDGLKNKSQVEFKGLRHDVVEKLYRQLKLREKFGKLLLLDIDEFNTSKACNICLQKSVENIKHGEQWERSPYCLHTTKRYLQCGGCTFTGASSLSSVLLEERVYASINLSLLTRSLIGNPDKDIQSQFRKKIFKRFKSTTTSQK
ncbi:uncharacterized protein BX663DRAFT_581935 [Cokeromyces recurvatus]|uniref:uncharacterized protein n=1 Tax=Cokeromyces recurvatus TaxID=90255 RepID=UPI00221F2E0B|nr:uncharacterized protein BX663DRAFT_581935 [Cokeromyces recurvatus]KAI7898357.1 hypothetical protein BX663DRAFT_581935 [Cokeromyces recurvatus]